MRLPMIAATILIVALGHSVADARSIPLPSRTENISGVPVTFTGSAVLNRRTCSALDARIRVSLADLAAKAIQIVKTSGVEKNEECGDKVRIDGASMTRSGSNLAVKVTGNVARQECVKTKVPEFRGLKVTMKTRVIASTTLDSNASVSAVFDPVVANEGRALRMNLVSGPHTRVSNDIAKALISVFNLDRRIDGKMKEAVTKALGRPDAMLPLPPELASLGIRFRDARIADGPTLEVDGQIPLPPGLEATTLALMGFGTDGCP